MASAKSVKDAIKQGVKPKKKAKGNVVGVKVTGTPKQKSPSEKVESVVPSLPAEKQGLYINATRVSENKPIRVKATDIAATSKQVYVNDIHSANPQILAVNLLLIIPNSAHIILKVSEQEYTKLLASKEAKSMNHLYSVVDNAVYPSLTYGSWKLDEITGELPTLDQIDEYDAKFKKMDVFFHNQPVYGSVILGEDDDLEIDFSEDDEDEDDASEEDFEIDFSEED